MPPDKALTVTELSRLVAGALRGIPRAVTVRAQIGNLGKGHVGHIFASLREDRLGVRCFIPARVANRISDSLAEGDTVLVRGRITWYDARGDIQLVADSVSLIDDTTRAREAIARLQADLERQGVLRANRSLVMAELPRRVAVVGGYTSAAVLDIVTAIHRRAPWIAVQLYGTRLQGDKAHHNIAAAIESAASSGADVVVVVRGGGASDDFAPFDTQTVCRAIARCRVPVVTALGHEQDRRLADLAAHTAASTPSDAARHIVPESSRLKDVVTTARNRMARALSQTLSRREATRTSTAARLCTSAQRVTNRTRTRAASMSLDQRLSRLVAAVGARHITARARAQREVDTTAGRITAHRDSLARARACGVAALRTRASTMRDTLEALRRRMHLAHPLNVLVRGFAIARDRHGNVLNSAELAISAGVLQLEFADGTVSVQVTTNP